MATTSEPAEPKTQGSIQSLARAFGLLEIIAKCSDGVTLTELSRASGLHSSTGFHLLRTMVGLGYLRQCQDSRRYFIGSRLFFLAASARSEVLLVNMVEPVARELASTSGNTTMFGIRSDDEIVVVFKAEGDEAFHISAKVHGTRPQHCTSMGKVLLADLPPDRLKHYLSTCELKAFTPNTITDRVRLEAEIAEVRRSGLAFDDAEFHSQLRCVAAPVRDLTNRVIGALSMVGPAWRLSLQMLYARAGLLRKAADSLSAQLGYRTDLGDRQAPIPSGSRNTIRIYSSGSSVADS